MKHALVAASLLVAALPGSGAAGEAGPSLPTGAIWRWVELRGSEPIEVSHPNRYTIEFGADAGYAFRADCNTGGGSYETHGAQLRLGEGRTTLAACPPGSLGPRFTRLLADVVGYSVHGEELWLELGGDVGPMVFQPQRELALAGTQWLVRAVNNGKQAVVSVVVGSTLTASFGKDGKLAGSAGCNRYTASYSVEGQQLTVGPAAATRKACSEPEGVMEQESAFLAALGSVARYEIRGERLQLRSAEGALAVDLVSAVEGTLSYRVRQALPEDARVRVVLEDVSLQDVPARVLGEQEFTTSGHQVPLAFQVAFDPTEIDSRHSYAVRAEIESADGRVVFRTTQSFPVITRDSPSFGVEIVLEPAR